MSVIIEILKNKEVTPAIVDSVFTRYIHTFNPSYLNEVAFTYDEKQFVGHCIEQFANYCKTLDAHERQKVIYEDDHFGQITFGDLYNWLDGDRVEHGARVLKEILLDIAEDWPADTPPLKVEDLKDVFSSLRGDTQNGA